jgi:protein SMG5
MRKNLVILAESILLEDFENIGKKTREILWRKVYYDPISASKKIWKKSERELGDKECEFLINFINEGIRHYKTLILKFEDLFNLDIRYIINFSIIANGADAFEKRSEKEMYTVKEINHATETIHCFLICLGDLHRYSMEFRFDERDVSHCISNCKELSASYYNEAFKLIPKNGMPQNQLGTLRAGENFELDSIFHYLYSLCSPIPIEMSEANVSKVFLHNAANLENAEPSGVFNVRDFIMQVTLLIDIIFYDKDIAEFKSLCASVIMGFREYLSKDRRNDLAFQLTSILMLCLLKLRINNSQKVACLNAFLVAYTAELVRVVIDKVDDFICEHKDENLKFCEMYEKRFIEFDRKVRSARETCKEKRHRGKDTPKDSGIEKNGSSQKDGSGSGQLSLESKLMSSETSDKSQPGQIKIAKRPVPNQVPVNHNRRRRKRRGMTGSSSSDESESINSDSEQSDVESMNSDFDSYDEDDDYLDMRFSSEDESEVAQESDGEDIVIENEEIVYQNDNWNNSRKY